MAFTAKPAVAHPMEELEDMEFEIEGLTDLGNGRFLLRGVRHLEIDHASVLDVLKRAGLDEHAAYGYVDKFIEDVGIGEMGKIFARRAKRVG
jgi:hypothetical protein